MNTAEALIRDTPAAHAAVRFASRSHVAEWALVLLAPPVAWWLFGIVLINQNEFIDPWFYTGYGRAFPALQEMFGWRYYAVRFPVVILNGFFLGGDHPLAGYVVLRYLLLLACGIPLYVWSRRTFGHAAAVLGYLFLFCNPLLPRIILWDLTTFISVPMALAGMAVWLWSDRASVRFLSGVLMMAAIASHVFTGTAIMVFLAVQAVRRIRSRELKGLIRDDVLATAFGAAASFAVGCLYFYAQVGSFDPRVVARVTLVAIGAGNGYAASHQSPFLAWAARESHVYIPVLCVAMSGVLLGRRVLRNTAVASVWWFGLLYTTAYFIYQFVFGRFVLETFYYFAHLSIVVFLLVPVIVGELRRAQPQQAALLVTSAGIAGLVFLPLANHLVPDVGVWVEDIGYNNFHALALLGCLAILLIVGAPLLARRGAAPVLVGVFLVLVQTLTFFNPVHRRVFDSQHRAREAGVYLAAIQMIDVFASVTTRDTQVMLWYCGAQRSLSSIASTVLLHTVNNPWVNELCDTQLKDHERKRLATIQPRYILMMSEGSERFDVQEGSLKQAGYQVRQMLRRTIGDDAYRAHLQLVEIERGTP